MVEKRYQVVDPSSGEYYDREKVFSTNSARAAVARAFRLIRELGLRSVIIEDTELGVEIGVINPPSGELYVDFGTHSGDWGDPESGLVSNVEAKIFLGWDEGIPPKDATEELERRMSRNARWATDNVSRAFWSLSRSWRS